MNGVELSEDQLAVLADMIADRLSARAAGELIDASELARRIGRSREFVYEHSEQLGAVRIGDGERPRLFFAWPGVLERLDGTAKRRTRKPTPALAIRPRRQRRTQPVELLPIGGASRRNHHKEGE